jgi:adenine-specific DNA-methyltransferase
MSQNPAFDKLIRKLKELFQLDQPDLDFGLYRIMHARADEISQFLDSDLLPQVKDAFSQYKTTDKAELEKELQQAIEQANGLGVDPETTAKAKELRQKIAEQGVDVTGLEQEVYDHLYKFFRRYYHGGDFLAKRVYKPGVYAIPYEGEEVKLHWANKDQYYIKTSEYLRDYAFTLKPGADDPMRVHFRLVDAAEGEHGNVKDAEGKNRVFILAGEDFIAEEDGEAGRELVIRFEYRPARMDDWPENIETSKKRSPGKPTKKELEKPPVQDHLKAFATERIFSVAESDFERWLPELTKSHIKADGEQADYSRLTVHLKRYTAHNTFDYFIHKDLGGFLRRELDFYIKNEVMHLDDIESETAPRVEQYLSKIKVIRQIAGKIIDFLTQLEDFQKKLWQKKKFVTETHYCITLDRVPEELYTEVASNKEQCEEWVNLFSIDDIKADLHNPGFSRPLTPEFLKANTHLVLDTRFFCRGFKERLLESIRNLDEQCEGILINGDNYHALSLMRNRFAKQIRFVYIDPPYNTGGDDFVYKDDYQHSSWLSFIESRASASLPLLSPACNYLSSIDDEESAKLRLLFDELLSATNFVADIAYERSGSSGLGQGGKIVNTKEHILAYSLDKAAMNDVHHEREIEFEALKRYNRILVNAGDRRHEASFVAPSTNEDVNIYRHCDFQMQTISLRKYSERKDDIHKEYAKNFDNVFRLTSVQKENEFQNRILEFCNDGLYSADYLVSRGRFAGENITLYYYNGQIFVWLRDSAKLVGEKILKSNKITDHWSHGEIPKADLANEGGVTLSRGKKPEQLMMRLIEWCSDEGDFVLDYFAGSGSTAAASMKLKRKFISIDAEYYFDEKSVRRIKNVLGGDKTGISRKAEWEGGGICKYLRLESYEDALNNLEPRRTETQSDLLTSQQAKGADGLREQYLLRYWLDVETRGSPSLLNIGAFTNPTAYQLKVKRPGSEETREVNVDLLETFNWLIGLTVEAIAAPQTVEAHFKSDDDPDLPKENPKRLLLKGRIREAEDGPWWFRTVTGTTPDGRKTLVIWRKLAGEPEQDNLVLDAWFKTQRYSAKDSEFDLIYVNGDNNLENLCQPDDTWKVRLIEEDFHRLMFEEVEA